MNTVDRGERVDSGLVIINVQRDNGDRALHKAFVIVLML